MRTLGSKYRNTVAPPPPLTLQRVARRCSPQVVKLETTHTQLTENPPNPTPLQTVTLVAAIPSGRCRCLGHSLRRWRAQPDDGRVGHSPERPIPGPRTDRAGQSSNTPES